MLFDLHDVSEIRRLERAGVRSCAWCAEGVARERVSIGDHRVIAEPRNRRNVGAIGDEHFRQDFRNRDALEEILARKAGLVEIAAEPAGVLVAIRRGRLPNLGRAEMRVIGIRIADALNDRNHPLVVERFERAHAGIETDVRVDRQHVVAVDRQRRTHLIVAIVAVRHDAVQPVVAAVRD